MPSKPPTFGRKAKASRPGGSATMRDQSSRYQRMRSRIMAAHPLCTYCMARGHVTAATHLDHIIALSLGGSNEEANLTPACEPCNDAKGRDETRYLKRGHDPRDIEYDPKLGEWIRLARTTSHSLDGK